MALSLTQGLVFPARIYETCGIVMVNKSICQEDITILSIYSPYRSPKCIKQKLTNLKGERNESISIVGHWKISFSEIKQEDRQLIRI